MYCAENKSKNEGNRGTVRSRGGHKVELASMKGGYGFFLILRLSYCILWTC